MTKVPSTRKRAHPPTRLGSELPGSSQKKRKVIEEEEEAPCGVSNAGKISASSSAKLRDPNGTSSSKDHAGGRTIDYTVVTNARGSPIKRRCMRTGHYLGLFTSLKGKRTGKVVKSKQSTVPTKTKKVKESQFQKLQRLPDGCHHDFDNDHLCSVNKLLEFRHKSQGAVFVDDKEHVMKTIFFISSVLPDACQPFLLVTNASLPLWKAGFNRFAPCINVVVLGEEKDVLKRIQNPDFHENGSHTMLHVLLAHPDVILEDIKSVEGIVWESVIVDYCQESVAKHLKQLKQLPTYFRMVLLSSPLKDSLPEYKKLLDFLNSEQEDSGDYIEADSLAMLRARFVRHIAYERKEGSSNFLEYWVPAYLSHVQLELYSSILLANSSVLQSQMTADSGEALRDVVVSLWKCCNHPCLVDLQHSLANSRDITESTDGRMCASGKILLLEKILREIRNKSLRVIVLFQSDGAVGDRMGNILEDLVRHKFGPESYERVQNRSTLAMKQEAMNMFNDATKGRFVFLIDSHACQPSINLSSIDSIIIYGSDRNPLNDLKALRKIKIGSQMKYVRIFRIYTPFTVEEKSLVLAKQSMVIDSNSQDIIPTLSHCLVSWGVSFLFNSVNELQQDNCTSKSNERGTAFMDKVILEVLTELSTEVEDSSNINSTTISKACMSGEFYSRNITLIGEREGVSSLHGDPPKFWLSLLDGTSHCQRYKPIEVTTEETNTSRRKRRNTCEMAGSSLDVINHGLLPEISAPSSPVLHVLPETGVENMSTPRSLHAEFKRELSKLIMELKLPDNVRFLANQFLEYLLKNHLVVREPRGILHAFNVALCWRAASFLKYTKLDRRESLALASDSLNYECNEENTELFYKKIGFLKEKFVHKPGGSINDRFSPHESSSANLRSDHNCPKQAIDLHGNFTNGTAAALQMVMVSDEQELISAPDADRERHLLSEESPSRDAMKRIDLFNSIFSSRERDIIEKQQLETLNLRTHRDNQVKKLKEVCHAVVQHILISNIDDKMKIDQRKLVIQWFTMFMHSFLVHMRLQFCKLDALHSTTWAEEKLMKGKLKLEVISGELDQLPDPCVTLPDSNSVVEEFIHFKKQSCDNHVEKNLTSDGDQLLDVRSMEITLVRNSVSPEACPTLAVRDEPTEVHIGCGGRAASESVDLPDNNHHCSSDGTDYRRACSASSIHASHDSINQESSTGDGRSIEHAKGDNIANPSMFPGTATSFVVGINAENDSTIAADPDHLESSILASPQNVMTLQHPTAEGEPSATLLAMGAQDLQTELQTSCPTLGAQHQKVHPDDSSIMNLKPDTANGTRQEGTSDHVGDSSKMNVGPDTTTTTGMLQEGTTSDHLGNISKMDVDPDTTIGMLQEEATSDHLDDSSMGVEEKDVDTAAADPLNSENQSYITPNNPAVMSEAWVAETQSDQSSMHAQHSTSLPTQRKLPISGHPPEEADPSRNLDTEAAQSLKPDIQVSSSMLDADSSETRHQPETTTVLSQGGIENYDVDNNGTVHAQKAHSESPSFAAPQSPVVLPLSLEAGTPGNLSKKQNGDNHADKKLALDGDQLLDDRSVEITPVCNSISPDACPTLAVRNDPTEAHMLSGGRASSESDLPDNNHHCSSDGTDYQRSCSASSIPASHDSINQESSTGDGRGIEHAKGDDIANPSMVSGSATSLVGINTENDSTVAAAPDHLESSILASPQPQNVMTLHHPFAEEPSDTLLAMSAQDLQTEKQTTCPTLGAQHQRVKLPISGHPPEGGPSRNLDTEAAQSLQPDIQLSSSMFDADSSETRHQVETATVLSQGGSENRDLDNIGTVHAQKTHSESPSFAGPQSPAILPLSLEAGTPDNLSSTSMIQSTTVLQNVEPSWDPRAEEGNRGMLSASDLLPGMQSSSPLQDQLVEAVGAGTSGTIAAQNLQPETQLSTSAQHMPPEGTEPDERIQIGPQPNTTLGPGPEQLAQLSTVAPASLLCSSEPLINELEKLKFWNSVLSKNHEQKKSQLQTECNQEIEKLKEKYELLLREEDSTFHRLTTHLNRVYTKLSVNQSLAEGFQYEFCKVLPAQERSTSPTIWQAPQSSQHAICGTTAAQTAPLPVASSLATRPPVLTSSHTTGPYLQPSQLARPPASAAVQLQPVLPGNLFRAAPSPVGSVPPRNGICGAVGAQSRGPVPHLQQRRMPAPSAMVHRDEQQPSIINPGVVPSRQSAPGMFESSASGNALAGIPLTSMTPSSVHLAMPSTSNSHPTFPASSLVPDSGPETMANFAQSNSMIPAAMASQQAPGLNPAFHHMGGGLLNATSGVQQAGAHIGGTAQAAPDQNHEMLHRLLRRLPPVMAPSSVQPTASSSHLGPMAARHQAGFPNPALDNMNMAGPLNAAAAGIRHPVARIGNQSYQVSASLLEWDAARRVGLIGGNRGIYPQGGSDLTGGPPGTSPQGSSSTITEVVCLSDDE